MNRGRIVPALTDRITTVCRQLIHELGCDPARNGDSSREIDHWITGLLRRECRAGVAREPAKNRIRDS